MTTAIIPASTAELQRQLDLAQAQAARYAYELQCLLARDRQKTQDLTAAYQQLQAYAQDLTRPLPRNVTKPENCTRPIARRCIGRSAPPTTKMRRRGPTSAA